MDIKSLLETEIEEKHIQNFIYYSMIFIVLFVVNFYVYFTYFRETFFEINIFKSILLVISFSFPIYFVNVFSYYIFEKNYIKIFQKEKVKKEKILKKINNYNQRIDKLNKLVENSEYIKRKYQLSSDSNFSQEYERAEKKLLNLTNESLVFKLNHVDVKETFNDYKNKINNRFKKSISIGGLGYLLSIIIAFIHSPKTFNDFLTKFIYFNFYIITITLSMITTLYLYGKFKKYRDKLSFKMSIIVLIFSLIPLIFPLFLIPNTQFIESHIYNFINSIL